MRLRRQLLLVSLLTLSLPWAGYRYIQEIESVLHQGQSAALTASARAVAARLGSEPDLLVSGLRSAPVPLAQEIYAHPLKAPAIVDGYSDDWRGYGIEPLVYQSAPGDLSADIRAGVKGRQLYLFIDVRDAAISYHHPGKDALASGDHLLLAQGRESKEPLVYRLRTSAPGSIAAVTHNSRGRVYQEHRIKGFWRERADGYQVELSLPLDFAAKGFGLSVVDGDEARPRQIIGSYRPQNASTGLGRVVVPQDDLSKEIAVFASPGLRLRVLDNHAWQLAEAGSLENPHLSAAAIQKTHWLVTSFYRAILKSTDLPLYPENQYRGRYSAVEVDQALAGIASSNWYQWGRRQLGAAAVPIRDASGKTMGVVVAEQTSDALLDLTNSAFTRLVLLSMGAVLFAALGLLGYASWLSWRVRRLSRAADNAVASDGKIGDLTQQWPSVRAGDEIGELSRSYHSLLTRLQAYTDYLKTLADKLSHELRTPLAVVRSSLDNLEHEKLPAQAEVYTERAKTGAERLSRLLAAISEASRMEASIQGSELEIFPLDELLKNVCAAYRDIYPAQTIKLDIAESKSGYQFLGAPDLLVQGLDKLVDNATDYCPENGEIRIGLLQRAIAGKGFWELRVENDGPLLPASMRDQLFDSLVSIRNKDGSGKTHMGLGLHIVRLVSQFHKGSAAAENLADGSGVVFTVTLPERSAGGQV